MKNPTKQTNPDAMSNFLAECRATATTASQAGLVLDRIDIKIGQMRADRAKLEGELQEAVMAGAGTDKMHGDIARLDQDLMTLEAALAGFGQRQRDLLKAETEADAKESMQRLVGASQTFEAAALKHKQAIEAAREAAGEMLAASAKLQRQVDQQIALGVYTMRDLALYRPDAIARRVGAGLTINGGSGLEQMRLRMDTALRDLLTGNSLKNIRANSQRHGKPGRDGLTRALVADGYVNLAKDIERRAGIRND